MHNEAVAHRDRPTKVPGLAILLTDNLIEQVFTGGVLLKKALLEKFYWRSFIEEILLEKFYWRSYTVGNVFILIIFRVGKRKFSWRNPVPGGRKEITEEGLQQNTEF